MLITLEAPFSCALMAVRENGCGMSSDALQLAFDPFFTEKQRRGQSGCGLGFSVSHAIIEQHNGGIFAHSDGTDCGSTFTIELPLHYSPVSTTESLACAQ